jgi:hypothetical protein
MAGVMMFAPAAWSVQPEQSYLGLGFGQSEFSGMDDIVASWPDVSGSRLEETSLAWKFYTGYQFSEWFAVETAWVDFGDLRAEADLQAPDAASLKISPYGFEFSGLATWPISTDARLFARAGILIWRAPQKIDLSDGLVAGDFPRPDRDGFSPALGLGGQWDFSERSSVRLEWQQYLELADDDPQTWVLSLVRRF